MPLAGVLLLIVAPSVGGMLQRALPAREYDADLEAVGLTGDPEGLTQALLVLDRRQQGVWDQLVVPGLGCTTFRSSHPSPHRTADSAAPQPAHAASGHHRPAQRRRALLRPGNRPLPVTRPAAVEAPKPSFGWRWLAPLIFVFLWSGGFAVAKIGLRDSTPMAFLAVRYLLVIIVLAALLAIIRPALPGHWRSYWHLAVTGFCIQVLYFGLSYLGLAQPAGGLALIVCLQPILVGLLAPGLVSGDRQLAALGRPGPRPERCGDRHHRPPRGQYAVAPGTLCAVGALAGITAGTLYEKRFGLNHHPVLANFVQYLLGLAVIGPLALLVETPVIHFTQSLCSASSISSSAIR